MRPLRGRAVILKWQQATKNLTPEGADKAAETLNSSIAKQVFYLVFDQRSYTATHRKQDYEYQYRSKYKKIAFKS